MEENIRFKGTTESALSSTLRQFEFIRTIIDSAMHSAR